MSRNPFVGKWTITDWKNGFLPATVFEVDKTVLTIGGDAPDVACDVDWHDQDELPCAMKSLPFDAWNAQLTAELFAVGFGQGPVVCSVTLSLTAPRKLKGCFKIPGDGNTGTFAADAHPGIDGSS